MTDVGFLVLSPLTCSTNSPISALVRSEMRFRGPFKDLLHALLQCALGNALLWNPIAEVDTNFEPGRESFFR